MFGYRRRRPLLATALVAGTATAAARHGARKQSEMEADRQFQMEQQAELRRYQEENDRRRNQREIDQAVNEALARQQAGNSVPGQQAYAGPAPAIVQPAPGQPPAYLGPDPYGSPGAASPYLQPGMAASPVPARPRSVSAVESGTRFCTECGSSCGMQDKFCRTCGTALSGGSYEQQPAKQAM